MIETPQALLHAVLRSDLGAFVAKVVATVSPGDVFLYNWHHDAIVYELMEVYGGHSRRLIITQPPRSLKSICTSVALVAWWLGHDPSKRFACVSYSQELAGTFARQFRVVVTSDWYRSLFPHMRIAKDTENECVTTQGGGRFAVPVGGSFTGRGADVIIIDDPMKAGDAQSETARRSTNDWYGTTLLSRLNDKERGAIILVMQRLHEDDLAGKLLREPGHWRHLDLSAIAQEDEEIPIGPDAVHHRKRGEALHPERESLERLEEIKKEMGSLAFSAQYLQRPVPLEGNLIKRDWLKYYDEPPSRGPGVQIVQSWDVASTTAGTSDYSVCTTWATVKRNYYLIGLWRGRLEFPQLRKKLVALADEHNPHRILIEQAGLGLPLIQELQANPEPGVPVPIGIKPEADKLVRMEAQAARFEAGQVYLPKEAPWLSELLPELLAFPYARHDDQVDSISQFLNWAEREHLWRSTIAIDCVKIIYG